MGNQRRALVQGHCAAGGAVHDRRYCGIARLDTQWLADRHHLRRRPSRRRHRLPRVACSADMDGRALGQFPNCGPGRGRRLALWPCCLRPRHTRSHSELAHSRQAGPGCSLSGALAGVNATTNAGLQPIVVKFDELDPFDHIYDIKWNSFSRIAASMPVIGTPFLWGPSPATPRGVALEQRELTIDGMAGTWMPKYSDAPGRPDFLRYTLPISPTTLATTGARRSSGSAAGAICYRPICSGSATSPASSSIPSSSASSRTWSTPEPPPGPAHPRSPRTGSTPSRAGRRFSPR